MAFSMNPGGSPGRSRFRGTSSLAEINIVPLVDVVMVLLVIFMLTAHVMEFGLEVDVPKVKQVKDSSQELPVITVTKDGELYLNDKPININALVPELKSRFQIDQGVYVRADKAVVWDALAQVIGTLGDGQVKVNVVTQPEDEAEKAAKQRR